MRENNHWDLIGDIHGYADELILMLAQLGYQKHKESYAHPQGRKVIYLGDYIDKGPKIRESLKIVRGMVDAGNALAIMGNHEYNALAYHTADNQGGWLRSHNKDHHAQHANTIEQIVDPHPEEWREWMNWFSTLPLFLDLGNLRVAHAGWDTKLTGHLKEIHRLDEPTLKEMNRRDSLLNEAKQVFLNGPELRLPKGHEIEDHAGVKRNTMRCRWWSSMKGKSYREAIFPSSEDAPDLLIPDQALEGLFAYSEEEVPLFFGHYALPPNTTPEPLQRNVACLDYSIAHHGGLTAYRWDGEGELTQDKFVVITKPINL